MIKIQNPEHNDFLSVVNDEGGDLTVGQVVERKGTDTMGNITVQEINDAVGKTKEDLLIVGKEDISRDQDMNEETANTIVDGAHCFAASRRGLIVEDDKLDANSASDFSGATFNDEIYVDANGFPCLVANKDTNSPVIGRFLEFANETVIYELL